MDNPNGGLAINQLVKMKCAGKITLEQFLELTAGVDGFTSETPVVFDDAEKEEPQTAASRAAGGVTGTGARTGRGRGRASRGLVSGSLSMAIYMGDSSHL